LPAVELSDAATRADDLALLLEAAAEAGAIAMRYFRKSPEVWMKGGRSPVSEADYAVDTFLRDTLTAARPDYGWLSEETADTPERLSAHRLFVVDPIDGTRGFLDGGDQWCVSVAVVEQGAPLAGVLQCPARKERFWAERGGGSFLDGARLRVVEIGHTPHVGGPKPMIDRLQAGRSGDISRVAYVPSLAYRIAMIAAGRMDATFVKPNSQDWDLAAADLILREAGGMICNATGAAPSYGGETTAHPALAAGSGELLRTMTGLLSGLAE
jgi:myo-inositol-1(or 4)-monophosphatase